MKLLVIWSLIYISSTKLVFDTAHGYKWKEKPPYALQGEDYHYVSPSLIIVADGVGGAGAENGHSSQEFARSISEYFACNLKTKNMPPVSQRSSLLTSIFQDWQLDNTKLMLQAKLNETTKCIPDQAVLTGASTLCILELQENEIKYVNMGDSGFRVYRYSHAKQSWGKVAESKEFQYSFNFPSQLGYNYGDVSMIDVNGVTAEDIVVQPYDIVISASDGLWDNIYDETVLDILRQQSRLDKIVQALQSYVEGHINDMSYISPFKKLFPSYVNEMFQKNMQNLDQNQKIELMRQRDKILAKQSFGGKADDLTIVVSQVKEDGKDLISEKELKSGPLIEEKLGSGAKGKKKEQEKLDIGNEMSLKVLLPLKERLKDYLQGCKDGKKKFLK